MAIILPGFLDEYVNVRCVLWVVRRRCDRRMVSCAEHYPDVRDFLVTLAGCWRERARQPTKFEFEKYSGETRKSSTTKTRLWNWVRQVRVVLIWMTLPRPHVWATGSAYNFQRSFSYFCRWRLPASVNLILIFFCTICELTNIYMSMITVPIVPYFPREVWNANFFFNWPVLGNFIRTYDSRMI